MLEIKFNYEPYLQISRKFKSNQKVLKETISLDEMIEINNEQLKLLQKLKALG